MTKNIAVTTQGIVVDKLHFASLPEVILPDFFYQLSTNTRVFHLERGISMYVLDDIGLRFWVRKNMIYQGQVVLEKILDEKIPYHPVTGKITIAQDTISLPLTMNYLRTVPELSLVKDEESMQYGLNIYTGYLGSTKYSFWADKNDQYVTLITFFCQVKVQEHLP